MSKLLFGAAALPGTQLLFAGWLADYQKQAAVDRLENWEARQGAGAEGGGRPVEMHANTSPRKIHRQARNTLSWRCPVSNWALQSQH